MSSYSDLTDPAAWQYWNATSNSRLAGQSNATPMAETWSPVYPDWKNVVTYYSCTPVGPWTERTIVYVTPESGAPGCSTGTLYTYNPKDHPEFANTAGVLLSYNVKRECWTGSALRQ
jgi:hypothetical protein